MFVSVACPRCTALVTVDARGPRPSRCRSCRTPVTVPGQHTPGREPPPALRPAA
jgi:hypothetical protein